jgi:hypothetical protein
MSRAPVWIVVGVLVWSAFLALGAFLGPAKDRGISSAPPNVQVDPELARKRQIYKWGRAALVSGCATLFIMFWAAMLLARRRRLQREFLEETELDL